MLISVESFDQIAKAVTTLEEASSTYTTLYTQLLQKANTMGAAWEGADNQAFVEQITGFTEELKAMAEKLSLAASIPNQEKTNYTKHMDDNITNVKKLKH